MREFRQNLQKFIINYYNYVIFILVAIITCYIIYKEVDFKEFVDVIQHSSFGYLALAILFLFLYWLMEAFMLQMLIKFEYPDETFGHAFSLMMIGQYYNQVTPSSSGGQPLQLLEMKTKGISLGFGTAVLVQKYALYQLSVTLIGIIGALFNIKLIMSWPPLGIVLLAIGITINLIGSILIILVALNPKIASTILRWLINVGAKLRLIKNKKKWFKRVDNFVNDYKVAIGALKDRVKETIFLFAFNLLAIIVYYTITYWIYRSLGLSSFSVWKIVLIQSVLYLMIAFVPLPGAAGGAELGFAIVFGAIFGAAISSVALITWRIITFYFILLFGAVYIGIRSLLIGKRKPEKLKKKNSDENV